VVVYKTQAAQAEGREVAVEAEPPAQLGYQVLTFRANDSSKGLKGSATGHQRCLWDFVPLALSSDAAFSFHFFVSFSSVLYAIYLGLSRMSAMSFLPHLSTDDADDWAGMSGLMLAPSQPSPPGSAPPTATSASSGEYNAFTFVGGVVSGGGSKRSLWVYPAENSGIKPCLGQVTFRFETLTNAEQDILLTAVNTPPLWEETFNALSKGEKPAWLQFPEIPSVPISTEDQPMTLSSPRASDKNLGIFAVYPTLSFDSDTSTAGSASITALIEFTDPGDLSIRVRRIESKLSKIKSAWPKPFADIEPSYLEMVSDIKTLESRTTLLSRQVVDTSNFPDSLSGQFQVLSATLQSLDSHLNLLAAEWETSLQGEVHLLDRRLEGFYSKVQALELNVQTVCSKLDVHDRWFAHIKPILSLVSSGSVPKQPDSTTMTEILNRLNALESKSAQTDPFISSPAVDLQTQVNLLEATVRDQANTISLLENRVVGAGVKMGDLVFQSFEDLLSWVKIKLPNGRFGFLVDGHSFLEFFTLSSHVDSESSAAAEHNAEKAGYATYYEMKVAASFNNLFSVSFWQIIVWRNG